MRDAGTQDLAAKGRLRGPWQALALASLLALTGLQGCATADLGGGQAAARKAPEQVLVVNKTSRAELVQAMGEGDKVRFDSGWEAWVYVDKPGVPLLVGLIPVVGEISDVMEMTGTRRELTVILDDKGIVRKYKLRASE